MNRQVGAGDLTQRLGMPARGVQDQQPTRPGELAQPLEALGDQRHLGRVARLRAHVQRHPVGGRWPAAPGPGVRRPALAPSPLATSAESSYAPQTRSAVRSTCSRPASIPNRSIARAASVPRSVSAYTARISSARPSRSSLSNAARDPEQLLQRRARRPPGDVIQRRGRAQPAADQRRDRLPDRQLLAPALRQRPIDRADQIQLP